MPNDKNLKRILALSVFAVALVTYLLTMAPTVSFWDCGELSASTAILGNPHPPGNPMYFLIGKAFMLLGSPFAQAVITTNFLSALSSALMIMMVFLFTEKFLDLLFKDKISRFIRYCPAVIAAFLVTFSDTVWFSAVETETYGSSFFIIMLISWLSLYWYENRESPKGTRALILLTYLAFLGMGINHFSIIAVPMIGVFVVLSDPEKRRDPLVWLTGAALISAIYAIGYFIWIALGMLALCAVVWLVSNPVWKKRSSFSMWLCGAALLGFSCYMYVPIRSLTTPDVDEGEAHTWPSFQDYLERKQYGSESMLGRSFYRRAHIQNQVLIHPHMGYGGYMLAQYFPWKVGEGSAEESQPVVRNIFGKRHEFSTLYLKLREHPQVQAFLFLLLQFPFLFGGYLVYKRNRQLGIYLLALYGITTFGMIFYMNFADGSQLELRDYEYWKSVGFDPAQKPPPVHMEVRERDYFFTPGFIYMGILFGVSAAFLLRWIAARRGSLVRPAGIALAALSMAIPAWSNYREHDRSGNYVPYDYAYNLLMSCRPNSILFTNGDNDTFPLWFVQEVEGIRKDVRVVNLSLANTDWYLRQLTGHEPVLKIGYTNDQLDALQPEAWPGKGPLEIQIPHSKIRYQLGPLPYLKVQDIMVLHIVMNNYPERPIHFAITVGDENEMGLDKFTVMEGMVYTLVEDSVNKAIDAPVTSRLVDSVYRFRGLGDPKVYVDLNTEGLLTNYSSTNFRLSMWAHDSLQVITQKLTDLRKVASPSDSVKKQIASLESDRAEKLAFAEKYLALNARILPNEWRVNYYAGQLYSDIGENQKAEEALRRGLKEAGPANSRVFAMNLAQLYTQEGQNAKAESTVSDMYAQTPDDFEAMYTLAGLYQRRGDLRKAHDLMTEWLTRNPSHQYAGAIGQQVQQLEAQMRAPAPPPSVHASGK